MANRLSPQMRRFVDAYLGACDGNAAKAAVAAGYSSEGAAQTASRLLTRPDIKAALDRVAERAELTTAQALQNVSALASHVPDKVSDAVILKANELILRVRGALTDKRQESRVTVNIGFLTSSDSALPTIQVMPQQAQVVPSGE